MKRSWIVAAIVILIVAVVLLQKKSKDQTAASPAPESPQSQAQSETQAKNQQAETVRQPAATGSQQTPVTSPLQAAPPVRQQVGNLKPVDVREAQRGVANNYAKYRSARQYQLPSGTFDVLSLRAVPRADFNGDENEIVGEKLGFVFVETSTIQNSRPTVINRSNGMLGVVTGTILVRTNDTSIAPVIAQKHSLRVLHVDQSIGLIYLSASPDTAPSLLNSIKATPSVTSVNLEIVESEARF